MARTRKNSKLQVRKPGLPTLRRNTRRVYDVFDYTFGGGAVFETPGVLETVESVPAVGGALKLVGGAKAAREFRRKANIPRRLVDMLVGEER